MLKRPLNSRFAAAVLDDKKETTIRDNPWPVGIPIMLYRWSGAPYRSKHIDIAPVVVKGFWTIRITHRADGTMIYDCGRETHRPLYKTEGFSTPKELDDWFRPLVKRGATVAKALILFRRAPARP
jgi:hypothetical protein